MKAFFDLRDASGGAAYIFSGKAQGPDRIIIPFKRLEGAGVEFETPLPQGISESYLGLPVSMLGFRLLEFPFDDIEKIRLTLPFELEGLILQGVDRVALDALPVGEWGGSDGGARKILAVYAEKRLLKNLIESLKAAGAEPAVITSIELAGATATGGADVAGALLAPPPAGEDKRTALAMAELDAPKPTINFRRGELEFMKAKEELSRLVKTSFVLAALLLLVFSVKSAVGLYFIHRQAVRIEERMDRSFSKIMPGQKIANSQVALMELEGGLSQLEKEQSQLGGLRALEALKELTGHRAGGAVIKEISMDPGGMIIKGEARTLGDVDAEKNALSQGGARVTVLETKNTPGNVALFTMSVKSSAANGH
ncbi:MAG: hypothetical protein M0Z48_13090 [Nitrospiraceae bacterium]|nr:hypothetical protein [Nitrospiraceae bacterium]